MVIEISVNDGWFEGTYLMVYSLVKRTKQICNIYCLSGNFPKFGKNSTIFNKEHEDIINNMVKTFNPKNSFKVIDCSKLYQECFHAIKWRKMWSDPHAMLRILCHKIPEFKSKVLHIDVDTMINGDVNEIYKIDLKGNEIAATRDRVILFKNFKRYFNSGVMLMDIDKIRETRSFDKCIEYMRTKKPYLPDQDAVNKFCKMMKFPGDDYRFNYQKPDMKPDTIIKHFFSSYRVDHRKFKIRQWEIDRVHNVLHIHCWDEDYKHFLQEKKKWKK